MNVADLIAILEGLPPNALVMVNGYEGGYCDPRVGGGIATIGQGTAYEGTHARRDQIALDEVMAWSEDHVLSNDLAVVVISRMEPDFLSLDDAIVALMMASGNVV